MFNDSINSIVRYGLYLIGWLFVAAGIFFLCKTAFGEYRYSEETMRWYNLGFSIGAFSWGFILLLLSKISLYIDRRMPEEQEEDYSEE